MLLVALILLIADPRLTLVARSKLIPPLYLLDPSAAPAAAVVAVLELLNLLALRAELMEGDLPLMLAVMLPLLSANAPTALVPAPVEEPAPTPAAEPLVVVRLLLVDLLLPFKLATMPEPAPVEEAVLGLRLLVPSSLRGSSPILPWCRNSSPSITSKGADGIKARSCAERSWSDIPQTQNSWDCPETGVAVEVPFGPAVEKPVVVELLPSLEGG